VRFDREIAMGIPDEPARIRILEKMSKGIRLAGDLDLQLLGRLTPGFVGADLSALTKEAALNAVTRAFSSLGDSRLFNSEGPPEPYSEQELAGLAVEMADFHAALTRVQPSALREGFATVPDVSWDDVGALAEVRAELDSAVCEPIRKAELFREWGLTVPVGVLLFGPPGCGKTLIAKAAANASGANFISIKGPELLNKYVGESERAVRLVFQRAISSAPCVIFFDELDALVPKRSAEGSGSSERVVNQMLTEMDGAQQRSQVFVIAATNRPYILDPAMLRPGRLDRLLYVPLPSEAGRLEILQTHAKKLPLADDVHLEGLASGCEGFSGADLAALVRETAYLAIREADLPGTSPRAIPEVPKEGDEASPPASKKTSITANDFARARSRVSASVGAEERREYEALSARLKSGRS
jgi:ribosome biogenesis ATPase